MRIQFALTPATALALALSACGGTTDGEGSNDAGAGGETEILAGFVEPADEAAGAATPPAVFARCSVCHSVEPGVNRAGPTLAGIVGREAGTVAGANYSPAMRNSAITWTEENLAQYLVDPGGVVPAGIMPPPGVNGDEARDIVDYLKAL
jgi:cytochrome c